MSNNLDELIKDIEALPDGKHNVFFLRHYNDFEHVGVTTDDLKALAARVQHLEAALRQIADRNAHGVMVTIARKALEETND